MELPPPLLPNSASVIALVSAVTGSEVRGTRLLRNAKVRSEIERLLEDPIGKRNETRARVIGELEQLAYTDDAIEIREDKDGNILDVSRRDKLKAIELLMKMNGLLTEKVDMKLSGGLSVTINKTPISGEVEDIGTVKRKSTDE